RSGPPTGSASSIRRTRSCGSGVVTDMVPPPDADDDGQMRALLAARIATVSGFVKILTGGGPPAGRGAALTLTLNAVGPPTQPPTHRCHGRWRGTASPATN